MPTPQDQLEAIKAIYAEHGQFCAKRGNASEADTRANIVDRILRDVLGWHTSAVSREGYARPGYIDYELSIGMPRVIIEAKRDGTSFAFPFKKQPRRHLKISGLLSTNKEAHEAVCQAQEYCIRCGVTFGVATNGYSFILFKAFIEGASWQDRSAVVFHSPKDIYTNFALFCNLLSYEGVQNGNLSEAFRTDDNRDRDFYRPISLRVDRDATYGRNPINTALRPHAERFFGDIAAQNDETILHECYVDSSPIQIIDKDLTLLIYDNAPAFAGDATQIRTTHSRPAGAFQDQITSAITTSNAASNIVVIMGGIGSGKSTFLRRFFRIVSPNTIAKEGPALLLYMDFLGAEDDPDKLDSYLWSRLKVALAEAVPSSTTYGVLTQLFARDLALIESIYADDPQRKQQLIRDKLFERAGDPRKFSEALLGHSAMITKLPICVFDNVDQLSTKSQTYIFTVAQSIARNYRTLSLLVLREESYSAALMQKHLTAYTIRPYHLSSPDIREMMQKRIEFAIRDLKAQNHPELFTTEAHHQQEIIDLFRLLKDSLFSRNKDIARLIHALSFGNTRLALELLKAFITSGAADMTKILDKYRLTGHYTVPSHEFVKSVILADYRYYSEGRSLVLNLFDVSNCRNSSHFASLRILRYLSRYSAYHSRNQGFTDINKLIADLSAPFNNEDDCVHQLMRLMGLNRQLVELDTRSTESLDGARQARITSAGQYYLHYLPYSFAYIDLVWQDTPINSKALADQLTSVMHRTFMDDRFKRVEAYLDYLSSEEHAEMSMLPPGVSAPAFLGPFMPHIELKYVRQKHIIQKRLAAHEPHS